MELMALKTRTGNALESFHRGQANALGVERARINNQSAKYDQVKQAMDMFGSVALGAMGGNLNGQVDPQKYEQGIEWLASQGMDVSSLRGKPELAPVMARGSLGVLNAINAGKGDREFDLRMKQFDLQMLQANERLEAMRRQGERDSARFNWEEEDRDRANAGLGPDGQSAPSGYRYTEAGELEAIPGGPFDPSVVADVNKAKQAGKPKKYTQLTAQAQKQLAEADDVVRSSINTISSMSEALDLSQKAYDGSGAGLRGAISGQFGSEAGQATTQLDNLIKGGALENLKATFGGMPTEGERKILIEIQGSSEQPAAVREKIYTRAIAASMAREAYNKRKAAAIRDGSYYAEGFDPNPEPYEKYMPLAKQIADEKAGRKPTVEDVTDKDQSRVIASGGNSKIVSYKDYFK